MQLCGILHNCILLLLNLYCGVVRRFVTHKLLKTRFKQKINKELKTTLPDFTLAIFIRKQRITEGTVERRMCQRKNKTKTLDIIILRKLMLQEQI